MTKGMLATHYGGQEVLQQLTDEKPSKIVPIFFIVSVASQIFLCVYKQIRSYKDKQLHTYIKLLRGNLG